MSWIFLLYFATLFCLENTQDKVMLSRTRELRIKDSFIKAVHANNEHECGVFCSKETLCVSVNFKHSGHDKGRCELNSKTVGESLQEACLAHPEYNYLELFKQVWVIFKGPMTRNFLLFYLKELAK